MKEKVKVAILASGNGSNAENIFRKIDNENIIIDLIASNKKDAFVIERAKNLGVDHFVFTKTEMNSGVLLDKLQKRKIDFIILAGFLLKIPECLINEFENRIINIHPALLPKYGGKGMYGDNVHKAVKESGDKSSGISIHLVNQDYDKGRIIFQAKCLINKEDTYNDIAEKVHKLEYEHFPRVIENYILGYMAKKEQDLEIF